MESEPRKPILVIEDAPDLQLLLTRILEKAGYEVLRANNGQEALDLLRSLSLMPAFILLDVMMPVMGGLEFREEQLKEPKLSQIPIVVMTARSDPQSMAQKIGATKVLSKPISMDDLLALAKSM